MRVLRQSLAFVTGICYWHLSHHALHAQVDDKQKADHMRTTMDRYIVVTTGAVFHAAASCACITLDVIAFCFVFIHE